jgi:hypothetical protein
MPSFEMMLPNGKTIDLTETVKNAKTEKELTAKLKTQFIENYRRNFPKTGKTGR